MPSTSKGKILPQYMQRLSNRKEAFLVTNKIDYKHLWYYLYKYIISRGLKKYRGLIKKISGEKNRDITFLGYC